MEKEIKSPDKDPTYSKKNQNIKKNLEHSGQNRAKRHARGEPHDVGHKA